MLAMTLLVKNERDILATNLEFHLARGIDHVIVTDNASDDGTRDILADYSRLAAVTVLDEPGDDFAQHRWVTRMALMAGEMGADWIISNDADEFWLPKAASLAEALEGVRGHIARCPRKNMVFPFDADTDPDLGLPWPERIVYRAAAPEPPPRLADPLNDPLTVPHFLRALPGKVALRAAGLVRVGQGNHDADYAFPVAAEPVAIDIFHYPVRSPAQFEAKIRQGGAAYARNTELAPRVGWHRRRWYRKLDIDGLAAVLAEAVPSRAQIDAGLDDGSILRDRTLCDPLQAIRARI